VTVFSTQHLGSTQRLGLATSNPANLAFDLTRVFDPSPVTIGARYDDEKSYRLKFANKNKNK